ncbi:MAG: 5-aminopentanamidase [Thermoleophilaceae bacterium]|jgi:predicted amidohydrolase|nr:5-aminopentanamidase [Thermoleophilaceae bacterium]
MHVTLAQLAPRSRDVRANLTRACELISGRAPTDLLVLPELFLSGYQLSDVEPLAVELDGPEVHELREAARNAGVAVVVGAAERSGGAVANSALCIDAAGELAGVYRKTHLFGAERDAYVAGDELVPVRLGERVLGVMICFDMEFPEVARTLARRGADLLVTISANSPPFELDHDVFARARALENGLPHVYVNRAGEEDGLPFSGGSMALDPDARVLVEAGAEGEAVVVAEVGEPGRRDPRTRYLELVRDEL